MRHKTLGVIAVIVVVALGALGGVASGSSGERSTGRLAANESLVRHCTDLYNQRRWEDLTVDCYATQAFVDHSPENGEPSTWGGFRATTEMADVAFPDWKTTIIDMTAKGDRVVMHFSGTGTQTGPLGSLPPTGRSVSITGQRMFVVRGGRITDTWVNYDEFGLLRQLGVVPNFHA